MINIYPLIKIDTWDNDHSSFISAMRIEKIAYALIGFLIIAIAGFTLMSMMSLSVMQMVSQIGILRALGASKNSITLIFLIPVPDSLGRIGSRESLEESRFSREFRRISDS